MEEIDDGFAELVSEAKDEFLKTNKLEKFFKIWDEMDKVEQENLVAFLIEKLCKD